MRKPDMPDSWLYQQRGWSIFRRRSILVSHWPAKLGPHSLVGYQGKKPLWSSAMLYRKISMIEQQNCTLMYTKLNITIYIHVYISLHFISTALYWIRTRFSCVTTKSFNHYSILSLTITTFKMKLGGKYYVCIRSFQHFRKFSLLLLTDRLLLTSQ